MNIHSIDEQFRFNFDQAYKVYSNTYDNWDILTQKAKNKARRYVEAGISESIQFRGVKTNLVSEEAFQTIVMERRKEQVPKSRRNSTEHPITHKNLALHCLTRDPKMTYEEYFSFWFDNLITTVTTSEENQRLKDHQASFQFGRDCWKEMYDNAGIKLMEMPSLVTNEDKRKHGIIE